MLSISVIIPVFDDAHLLESTLRALHPDREEIEVIVVDGKPPARSDQPEELPAWVRHLHGEPGRGIQMNAGARAAQGDILVFLHADTILEPGWAESVQEACSHPDFSIGAFRFKLDSRRWPFRALEWGVRIRSTVLRLPYGDQALFVRAEDFERAGGYKPVPLMEDVDLVRRFRRRGKLVCLSKNATSSARNWERDGIARRTALNLRTLFRYFLGVPPEILAESYSGEKTALLVFCKEPVPGRVKTRLAATVGEERATSIYRDLVARTLKAVADCPGKPRIYVFFAPAGAGRAIRDWIGPGKTYVPQSDGDLGFRMESALRHVFEAGVKKAVLIGTDCPDLSPENLADAFRKLRRNQVVLGPTEDGGYYLVGCTDVWHSLFTGISWSTPDVLRQTRVKLTDHNLRYALLPTLRDLDDQEDLVAHELNGMINP